MNDLGETVKAQAVDDFAPRARIVYANLCQRDKDLLTKFFIEENTIVYMILKIIIISLKDWRMEIIVVGLDYYLLRVRLFMQILRILNQ